MRMFMTAAERYKRFIYLSKKQYENMIVLALSDSMVSKFGCRLLLPCGDRCSSVARTLPIPEGETMHAPVLALPMDRTTVFVNCDSSNKRALQVASRSVGVSDVTLLASREQTDSGQKLRTRVRCIDRSHLSHLILDLRREQFEAQNAISYSHLGDLKYTYTEPSRLERRRCECTDSRLAASSDSISGMVGLKVVTSTMSTEGLRRHPGSDRGLCCSRVRTWESSEPECPSLISTFSVLCVSNEYSHRESDYSIVAVDTNSDAIELELRDLVFADNLRTSLSSLLSHCNLEPVDCDRLFCSQEVSLIYVRI
ncbi:hypothetical protein Tco_0922086 [Tanacetum coccineum]|uniref:Uncharacterized protein n=1 Tax=Tanacetum coccineum TaxID=301880 RepID=A0ABQ5CZV6_9ASTR